MTQSTTVKYTSTADLVRVDQALESMRDAGFDLSAAGGEHVDNSIEARATIIRIASVEKFNLGEKKGKGKTSRPIEAVVFADNGIGITPDILAHTLTLGYSTRYNKRNGMGRFGVGMKLAAISQARRIDIYTRPLGNDKYYHTYFDLDLIASGQQKNIEAQVINDFPSEYQYLMQFPSQHQKNGEAFESGTMIVWSKIDRLVEGGIYGSSIEERMQNFTRFLARAYRKFIDRGTYIELNGQEITLHDPLFLLENPRAAKNFHDIDDPDNLRAKVIERTEIDIDGHSVFVTVTLCPEVFRKVRGEGGSEKRGGSKFKGLYIPDNERRISILRNEREIYYDVINRMFPAMKDSKAEQMDRFIGVEVNFPAALDEYFQVRHVKRGAEPVSKLREKIKQFIERPILAARREILDRWDQTAKTEHQRTKEHQQAQSVAERVEQTLPRGKAGLNITPQQEERIVSDLLFDLGIDPEKEPEKVKEVEQQIHEQPITFSDGAWPGKEFFEITHLNGKAIIRLNHRHPFIRQIYDPIKEMAKTNSENVSVEDALRLMRKADIALDVLFMAYSKAENLHSDPERAYGELRSYWGMFTQVYVDEALSSEQMG